MSKQISNSRVKQITDIAFQLVSDANILKAPININLIVKSSGITLEETDLGEDMSGLLLIHDNSAVIAYSSRQGSQRKRFTIAHELGHYMLHRELNADTVFLDKDFIVKYRSNKLYSEVEIRQEQEANAFAAALLMPKEFIFDELNKESLKSLHESELIERLASIFEVSVPAMTFRLTNLNLLF